MTLDEIIREGRICGIDYEEIYYMTLAEVQEYVLIYYERKRRRNKDLALLLYTEASIIARMVMGSSQNPVQAVYEEFPYWTDEEVKELLLNKYRAIMNRSAGVNDEQ